MRFDEWTTEAHRSLQEWNPEPAIPPAAPTARPEADVLSPDAIWTSASVEPSSVRDRQPASTGRKLLSAAAAVVFVAAAAAFVAQVAQGLSPADDGVATGPQTEPTHPAGAPSTTVPPSDAGAGPSSALRFSCTAPDQERGAPTDEFDTSTSVAEWRAVDVDDPELQPPTSGPVNYVQGTLIAPEGEDLAGKAARGATFVAALDPTWWCTVWSPVVGVADPSRPGPIVDENHLVTNRLSGMCFVPDASATPDSVWGIDPSLAAALDRIDALTDWTVILADGGRNGQGPGRLWMEFTFEADPGDPDRGPVNRVLTDVSAAVEAAGATAGVDAECSAH